MNIKRSLKGLFFGAAVMLGGGMFAANAGAAEIGQCFNTEQLNVVMKDEGQHTMAIATRWIKNPETGFRTDPKGNIFTSNDDGSRGYVLEADDQIGKPLKKICITLKLHDVKFFDTNIPGVPEEALTHGDRDRALQFCKDKGFGSCNFHDDVLKRAEEKLGEHVMMQGRTDRGTLVTLSASVPGNGGGGLGMTFPEGAIVSAGVFEDVKKTPALVALFEEKRNEGITVAKAGDPPLSPALN
ncbi:MAG: hypothetical protein AB7S78_14185 [Candidatus Omnitrophota bacterium]